MSSKVILQPDRDKSVRRRHPWIFASAIGRSHGRLGIGETVDVFDAKQQWLGRGAWSPESQIRVRLWTFAQTDVIDNGFFLRRIQNAWQARQDLIQRHQLNAYRLVAAESDGLPGVTIDRYADVLVCQLLSAGAEKHREKILWALGKCFPECALYERSDVAVREKEGLQQRQGLVSGELPEEIVIQENNGVQLLVDVKSGHKTGYYLDQRDNRAIAASYASGRRVLNCFSYTGGFAVHALQQGATQVVNLDVSQEALALAQRNIALNKLDADKVVMRQVDVFQALRDYHQQGERFGQIVLDPPKFIESKAHLNKASRGYKDINMNAIKLLEPGGILCTFSCSGLMSQQLFQKIVADAALDAGRELQILRWLTQAEDHPVAAAYPEGLYLKGLVCRVS